ncbi:glycoside hydrolase family 55 protein [Pisolithus marmoratus]|nr:glycoside hydrolase family 55 protein [Pisolithus marmoratus]
MKASFLSTFRVFLFLRRSRSMGLFATLLCLGTVLSSSHPVFSLGSLCSAPLNGGTAAPGDPYWLESIKHQGTSAFNPNPSSYQVFRNVKDFGATGNGVTDDTAAIKTYLVSSAINTYYYTQMIGDARNPPTLLASPNFSGFAVIDADPYIPNGYGAQWFVNQDNFYRSVRNLIIDLRQIPASTTAIGLHWQVSQATSLINVIVEMSTASGNKHQGMFMENGSGGFMGDIVFNGGNYGIQVGNQQFTVRNLTVNNANIAVSGIWDWGFTFQGVTINSCQTVGSEAIIDAVVTNTPIFVRTSTASNGKLGGSLVLNNIKLNNVPTAVGVNNGPTVLAGGTVTITSWGQGNVFSGTSGTPTFTQGNIVSASKPSSLLDSSGRIFGKSHPQYANYAASQFISVKSQGAAGDGHTDDTAAIQNVINQFSGRDDVTHHAMYSTPGCMIIFFDAGTYYITNTITIPAGTQIVGEAWSVILAGGSAFQNQNSPKAVIQAGTAGSTGLMEISDMIFSTAGPAPGAILLEWNVHDPSGQQGAAGLWDTHISQCPSGSVNTNCQAAFLGIHLTSGSSAYFEGTWVWTADHDLDAGNSAQISVFTGRGVLSQSAGPVWLIGTASEHAALYQYNLAGAQNHWIGFPYYQPVPAAPAPYSSTSTYSDPSFSSSINMAWGMWVQSSYNIILFGAGFYSFFQNYAQSCLNTWNCQSQIFNIDSSSTITVYSLSTVGTTYQLSVSQIGVVNESSNQDGFQETLTVWSR